MLMINFQTGVRASWSHWARTCAQPDSDARTCPVAITGAVTVRAVFAAAICSPDGFCWEKAVPQEK